jgi:hypothetical protein
MSRIVKRQGKNIRENSGELFRSEEKTRVGQTKDNTKKNEEAIFLPSAGKEWRGRRDSNPRPLP